MNSSRHAIVLCCLCLVVSCNSHKQSSPPTHGPNNSNNSGNANNPINSNNKKPPSPPPPVCTTGLVVDANLTITSKIGPTSSINNGKPIPINNGLYSVNLDDFVQSDYVKSNPGFKQSTYNDFVTYLKALNPGYIRFPEGIHSLYYQFNATAETAEFNFGPGNLLNATILADYMDLCTKTGAQPYLAVNVSNYGTSQNAVDMITYTNKTMGYNVKWWQLGNEPDLVHGDANLNFATPAAYATLFAQYANAMKAVDPTIHVVGAEFYTAEDFLGEHGQTDWITPILQQLQNLNTNIDAIGWHYYPLYSGDTSLSTGGGGSINGNDLLQENKSDWPPAGLDFASQLFPILRKTLATYPISSQAQIWVDEVAEDPGSYLVSYGLGNVGIGALWAADMLGRFAENGASVTSKFIFNADPFIVPNAESPAVEGYSLLDLNHNIVPEYYAYWLYAQHFGDHVVYASNDNQKTNSEGIVPIAIHASTNSRNGSLQVIMVNKEAIPHNVQLRLTDFTTSKAEQYQIIVDGYQSTDISINQQTLDATNVGSGITPDTIQPCTTNIVTLPALSITMQIFYP